MESVLKMALNGQLVVICSLFAFAGTGQAKTSKFSVKALAESATVTAARPAKSPQAKAASKTSNDYLSNSQDSSGAQDAQALGGADGGGGNTLVSRELTAKDFKEAMRLLPAYVEKVLFFQEYLFEQSFDREYQWAWQDPGEYSQTMFSQGMIGNQIENVDIEELRTVDYKMLHETQQKMFRPLPGRPSVFSLIGKTHFALKGQGPCLDSHQRPRDGVTVQAGSSRDQICLSLDRLRKKLTRSNFVSQMLALAVHELSHRVGVGEKEAVNLQRVVEATVRQPTWEALYLFVREDIRVMTPMAIKTSSEYLESEPFDALRFCGSLIELQSHLIWHRTDLFHSGALAKPLRGLKALIAANTQMDALTGFCTYRPDQDAKHASDRGRTLRFFNDDRNNETVFLNEGFLDYRWGFYQDRDAARFNLDQLRRNIQLYDQIDVTYQIRNDYDDIRLSSETNQD